MLDFLSPYIAVLKACAVAAFLAWLAYWHIGSVKEAHRAGYEAARGEYQAKYNQELSDAKKSADEVHARIVASNEKLLSNVASDADRMRKQLAAARSSGKPVQAGIASDKREGDSGRKDDNREATRADQIDNAISDAVAEYRAALLSCGQSVGAVAERMK